MEATNLADLYHLPLLDWAPLEARLAAGLRQAPGSGGPDRHTCWLATINPDGSPHVTGVGALWADGCWWFETGKGTRKGKNLARDPRCTLSVAALGGPASAGLLSAARTTAHAAPAVPVNGTTVQGVTAGAKSGAWGNARTVPGLAALNKGNAAAAALSCATPGNCAIAGDYTDARRRSHVLVTDEKKGAWGNAHMISFGQLDPGGTETAVSVSCGSPENCAVSGSYFTADGNEQAFVLNVTR